MPKKLIPKHFYEKKKLAFANHVQMDLFKKGDVISDNIAFMGFYEEVLSAAIVSLAKGSKTMVDAGANMGYFSLLFAANSLSPEVYAFEPSTHIFDILRENIRSNGLSKCISPVKKAVSAFSGNLNFDVGNENQSGWGFVNEKSTTKVACVSLDDFFSDRKDFVIDVLKIDVEGHELKVFEGCKNLLAENRIQNIFFEIGIQQTATKGTLENELIHKLESLGYIVQLLEDKVMHASFKK